MARTLPLAAVWSVVVLLSLVRPAACHVRMNGRLQKYGSVTLPIRNANAVGANGAASVGGPCGGSASYKATTAPDVLDGGVVQLSLEYAAGHEDEANLFKVTMACGAPTQTELRADNAKSTVLTAQQCKVTQGGTIYPVPAKTGRDAKVVECTLPKINNLDGDGGHCSLSVQDQRFWGGCVDIKLVDAATMAENKKAAAIAPPSPPEPPGMISEQTVTNIVTSGPPPSLPCCGLKYANLQIKKGDTPDSTTSAILLTGYAFGLFCDSGLGFTGNRVDLMLDGEKELTEDKPLRLIGAPGEKSFESEASSGIKINTIPAQISYTAGYLSVTMLGDSSVNPTVCDSGILFTPTPEFGAPCRDGGRCGDELSSSGISTHGSMLLMALVAVVGVVWLP